MKLLHLADLHLGKILQEQSLIEDQEYMLNQIIKLIKKENVETVLISGDVYDRSVPPAEAVNLLDSFLKTLIKELKIKVFIIAGNHDSKDRLGFGSKIFEDEGLYIESKYTGNLRKVELQDEYGKLNIYMLPFVKPVEVKQFFEDDLENNYNIAINKIIGKEEINKRERNIILVHQFVTAGTIEPERTESEVLSLGGIENVDVSNFNDFDYVAIGHVHRPQKIGRDTARYAGTMLKYSFSEINHNKTVSIIEIKEKGDININLVQLNPLRDMREIKGPLEELIKPENYECGNTNDYIKAVITNEEPVYDAIGQIRRIYPNTLKLEIRNSKTINNVEEQNINLENIKKKTELELFADFYKSQNNVELDERQTEIIKNIISEVKNEAD